MKWCSTDTFWLCVYDHHLQKKKMEVKSCDEVKKMTLSVTPDQMFRFWFFCWLQDVGSFSFRCTQGGVPVDNQMGILFSRNIRSIEPLSFPIIVVCGKQFVFCEILWLLWQTVSPCTSSYGRRKCYLENLGQGTNWSSFEGVGSWQLHITDGVAAVGVH